jgi:type IV pilus assembly protein PilF
MMRHERATAVLIAAALALALAGCGGMGGARAGSTKSSNAAEQHVQMGRAYMQRGQLEIALERLTKALELDPRSTDAHTVIAVLYERINRPERAETHYKRAVELAPEAGSVNNNFGQYLCRVGRYDEAQARFAKAMDDPFYSTPALVYTNAGVCALRAGKLDQAERHLRRSLELEPENPDVLLDLARLQLDRGEPLRARAFLQRHEALSTPRPDALALGITIETRLNDTAAADRYRQRLRSEFPDHDDSPVLQGGAANQ